MVGLNIEKCCEPPKQKLGKRLLHQFDVVKSGLQVLMDLWHNGDLKTRQFAASAFLNISKFSGTSNDFFRLNENVNPEVPFILRKSIRRSFVRPRY
jgi:hypothetical protein